MAHADKGMGEKRGAAAHSSGVLKRMKQAEDTAVSKKKRPK